MGKLSIYYPPGLENKFKTQTAFQPVVNHVARVNGAVALPLC